MQNRRQFTRMPLGAIAYTTVKGEVVRSRIVNISRGGVLLELSGIDQNLPDTGDPAAVAIDLPRNPVFSPRSLNCKGVIVRATSKPGQPSYFAIQFTSVNIRPGAAVLCLRSRSRRVSERQGEIHLVHTTSRSSRAEGIQTRPRKRHLGA